VRDDAVPPPPAQWPPVAVIIPARNEAKFIAASVGSLLRQDYRGLLTIIVVDDDSSDGTGALALGVADGMARANVTVMPSLGLPAGWTGKVWAVKQGIAAAEALPLKPQYLLLTDADIVHAPDALSWLVAYALSRRLVLTSLMAKLRCETFAERSHVPALVYFFQMLFPFRWVSRTDNATAAAAGHCMLVRTDALQAIGGVDTVRNSLIDDCALAGELKPRGAIWLGLSERVRSLRPCANLRTASELASRLAYEQLRYSLSLALASIAAMFTVFLAPPLLALLAQGPASWMGLVAWLAMAVSFQPTLRFYRLSPSWGLALPIIALLYTYYTLASAYQHTRRRGGQWKGRLHIDAPSLQ